MGKSLRRVQRKLAARMKACVEARDHQRRVNSNPKVRANVDKAFKMPGSRKLS